MVVRYFLPFDGRKSIDVEKENLPTYDRKYLHMDTPVPPLNFNSGDAAFCIESLVQHEDLMRAHERIKVECEDGKSFC